MSIVLEKGFTLNIPLRTPILKHYFRLNELLLQVGARAKLILT